MFEKAVEESVQGFSIEDLQPDQVKEQTQGRVLYMVSEVLPGWSVQTVRCGCRCLRWCSAMWSWKPLRGSRGVPCSSGRVSSPLVGVVAGASRQREGGETWEMVEGSSTLP